MYTPLPTEWLCDCVSLPGKTDFVDVIKLRILKWEDYDRFCGWVHCNHQDIIRGRQEGMGDREGDKTEIWTF